MIARQHHAQRRAAFDALQRAHALERPRPLRAERSPQRRGVLAEQARVLGDDEIGHGAVARVLQGDAAENSLAAAA
ncbi:hypothetical protein [Lysobacter sp. yr284]|uniref:hypothetical protein n=1 Tax=Lysobacter sp. yr284 TaxID=1761791 RepID=UPI001113606A|nr:hypothetical protein [Lysobacter sp. yr284]